MPPAARAAWTLRWPRMPVRSRLSPPTPTPISQFFLLLQASAHRPHTAAAQPTPQLVTGGCLFSSSQTGIRLSRSPRIDPSRIGQTGQARQLKHACTQQQQLSVLYESYLLVSLLLEQAMPVPDESKPAAKVFVYSFTARLSS